MISWPADEYQQSDQNAAGDVWPYRCWANTDRLHVYYDDHGRQVVGPRECERRATTDIGLCAQHYEEIVPNARHRHPISA